MKVKAEEGVGDYGQEMEVSCGELANEVEKDAISPEWHAQVVNWTMNEIELGPFMNRQNQ